MFCNFLNFHIPENLFFDPVDGYTRNLKLSLNDAQNRPVNKTSWILVDSNIQVIYGYLKIQDYIRYGGKHVFYNLVATNSRGGSTSLLFRVNLPGKMPQILYEVTMTVTPFYQESVAEINEQLLIVTKISEYFGRPSRFSWINIVSFERQKDENKITVAWTNCTLTTTQCKSGDVKAIASKVVLNNGVANTNFARFMSPQYIIHGIQASISAACHTTPVLASSTIIGTSFPAIINKIPVLKISTMGFFQYKVR